jgi:hypothetical protein
VAAAQASYNEVSEEAKALQAKLHARSSLLGKIKAAESNIKATDKLMQEQDVRMEWDGGSRVEAKAVLWHAKPRTPLGVMKLFACQALMFTCL